MYISGSETKFLKRGWILSGVAQGEMNWEGLGMPIHLHKQKCVSTVQNGQPYAIAGCWREDFVVCAYALNSSAEYVFGVSGTTILLDLL